MRLKIRIQTPKGQAQATEKKLRGWILGISPHGKVETESNPEDNQIIWTIETDIKHAMSIQRNVIRYDQLISGIFQNKLLQRVIRARVPQAQQKELEDMLKNQTRIEIIKDGVGQEV